MIDSKKVEEEHGKENMKYKYEFVDADVRNAFNSKKVTVSMMKCTHGFNHHGLRDSLKIIMQLTLIALDARR